MQSGDIRWTRAHRLTLFRGEHEIDRQVFAHETIRGGRVALIRDGRIVKPGDEHSKRSRGPRRESHAEHLVAFSCKRRGFCPSCGARRMVDGAAWLVDQVLPPRLNLTRFHGVFAPNSRYRAQVTPARRGRGAKPQQSVPDEARTPAEQPVAMRWAQRLKRVFKIDVEICSACGRAVRIIACIEDPAVIDRILSHLSKKDVPGLWPQSRGPPVERTGLLH